MTTSEALGSDCQHPAGTCREKKKHPGSKYCIVHEHRLWKTGELGPVERLRRKHLPPSELSYYEQFRDEQRKRMVESSYNVSYEDLFALQGGSCGICGKTEEENGQRLCVDHDHSCCPTKRKSCGKCVRGLLCSNCNTGLGYFNDNKDRLQSAIKYLAE